MFIYYIYHKLKFSYEKTKKEEVKNLLIDDFNLMRVINSDNLSNSSEKVKNIMRKILQVSL